MTACTELLDTLDDMSLTRPRPLALPKSGSNQSCLVLIYPANSSMGSRYMLGATPVQLGRVSNCDITLEDHSISRRHVQLEPVEGGYQVIDLGSTNGTFINDRRVSRAMLKDGDYLRLGNSILRYLAGGNVEADYHEEIYKLSIFDALTGAHNKRYLMEHLQDEIFRARRFYRPLAVILLDIDAFKALNDELGHLAGDFFLRELASRVRSGLHESDLFARYGGEEFALILVETTLEQARARAEAIRRLIAATPFRYGEVTRTVTASLGVASWNSAAGQTAVQLLQQADDGLYRAKREGRNRVAVAA